MLWLIFLYLQLYLPCSPFFFFLNDPAPPDIYPLPPPAPLPIPALSCRGRPPALAPPESAPAFRWRRGEVPGPSRAGPPPRGGRPPAPRPPAAPVFCPPVPP